jgi:hypothetical protein
MTTSDEQLNAEFQGRVSRGMSEQTALEATMREHAADVRAERERREEPGVVEAELKAAAKYAAAERAARKGELRTLAERLEFNAQLAAAEDELARQAQKYVQADSLPESQPVAAPAAGPPWRTLDKARQAKNEREGRPVTQAEMKALETDMGHWVSRVSRWARGKPV